MEQLRAVQTECESPISRGLDPKTKGLDPKIFVLYHHKLRQLWRRLYMPSEQRHLVKARLDSCDVTEALVVLQSTVEHISAAFAHCANIVQLRS